MSVEAGHGAGSIGIDVGGASTRVARVAPNGRIEDLRVAPTPAGGDPVALGRLLREQVTSLGHASAAQPIGVALPGARDAATGRMLRAVNLPRLEGLHVESWLREALGRESAIDSDANAAAWAQWSALSAGAGVARFAYLTLGTGIGGAVILDGELVRHTRGGAGHFGHLIVESGECAAACGCGSRGCLETVASGRALENAAPQDRDRAARALAIAIANISRIYATQCVALGGGAVEHADWLIDATRLALAPLLGPLDDPQFRLTRAPLSSDHAGVIGAALLARRAARLDRAAAMG